MKSKDRVVVREDGLTCTLDLQDFPHGELEGVRKDGGYDIEFYSVPESLEVPSYNPETGKVEWRPVKYWSIHRGKKTEIVTLSDGSQIYTDNDPRAIYGVAADTETLEPGRFTPTEAKEHKVLVPITTENLVKNPPLTWYDFETGFMSGHKTEHSVDLGFSFGQFIGIMAGDGWATHAYVRLADNEGYNIKFVTDFMRMVFPNFYTKEYVHKKEEDPSRYGDTKCYSLNTGHTYFYARIKELVDGHGDEKTSGSANKRLPVWYQLTRRDFIEGLVCGMIATDGTVAVSNGKAKPQLRIQYTSTSFRLAREFQRCCRLLGVRASVAFSKRTSGGNEAWNVTVSAIDAKRTGLLNKCCHARKRETFQNTDVLLDAVHAKNDIIPFPKKVAETIVKLIPAVKKPLTPYEHTQQSICINVRKFAKLGYITRSLVRQVLQYCTKAWQEDVQDREHMRNILGRPEYSCLVTGHVTIPAHIEAVLHRGVEACRARLSERNEVGECLKDLYSVRKTGRLTAFQYNRMLHLLDEAGTTSEALACKELQDLVKLANSDVRWEFIEKIEKTDVEQIGFDLTVPGYDTFVNSDGVVLSNTVNIHVPASAKASKEALEKMLPSKNLFSLTDMTSVRYKPEKEQVSGLWALTAGMNNKPVRTFRTKAEAIRAYRDGEIGPNDPVEVLK